MLFERCSRSLGCDSKVRGSFAFLQKWCFTLLSYVTGLGICSMRPERQLWDLVSGLTLCHGSIHLDRNLDLEATSRGVWHRPPRIQFNSILSLFTFVKTVWHSEIVRLKIFSSWTHPTKSHDTQNGGARATKYSQEISVLRNGNTNIFAYHSVEKTFKISNESWFNPPSSELRFRWSSRKFTHEITDILIWGKKDVRRRLWSPNQ